MTTPSNKPKAAPTIGIVKRVSYAYTRCIVCDFRKDWHSVNAHTEEPTDTNLFNARKWAAEAGWTQNARKQYVCPRCSQGLSPLAPTKTVADVVTLLDNLQAKIAESNATTDAVISRMNGPSQTDIASAVAQFQQELNAISQDIFEDNGDDRYNFEDNDADADIDDTKPITMTEGITLVYRMFSAAQKARSNFIEAQGDPTEDPAAKHVGETLAPWLFGENNVLIGFQRVIDKIESTGELSNGDFMNLTIIATKFEPSIGIIAQLPIQQFPLIGHHWASEKTTEREAQS